MAKSRPPADVFAKLADPGRSATGVLALSTPDVELVSLLAWP